MTGAGVAGCGGKNATCVQTDDMVGVFYLLLVVLYLPCLSTVCTSAEIIYQEGGRGKGGQGVTSCMHIAF